MAAAVAGAARHAPGYAATARPAPGRLVALYPFANAGASGRLEQDLWMNFYFNLGFRRMRGVVPDSFFNSCPGEPTAVRAVAGNIDLADVKYSESALFSHMTAALTLRASADVTTTNLPASGTVVQHARWAVARMEARGV